MPIKCQHVDRCGKVDREIARVRSISACLCKPQPLYKTTTVVLWLLNALLLGRNVLYQFCPSCGAAYRPEQWVTHVRAGVLYRLPCEHTILEPLKAPDRPGTARPRHKEEEVMTTNLPSERIVRSAPLSFDGSTRRLWRWLSPRASAAHGWPAAGWWTLLVTLLVLAWVLVLAWYCLVLVPLVPLVLFVPYRLMRRKQRTEHRNELQHRELMERGAGIGPAPGERR
jgi:hypothetical protein